MDTDPRETDQITAEILSAITSFSPQSDLAWDTGTVRLASCLVISPDRVSVFEIIDGVVPLSQMAGLT